jgi:hypothetical protein
VDQILWIFLPLVIAAGSALLSFVVMQGKLDVAVARERAALAEANALLRSQQQILDVRVRAAEESCYRKALDGFLGEFRVEERQYTRETRDSTSTRKFMVLQERLYFREVPLSNWVEHELAVEENCDPESLAAQSCFRRIASDKEGSNIMPALLVPTGRTATTAM